MTRDEAVKKAEACFQFNIPGQEWLFTPLRLVAALENLGVLKLDEPKSAHDCFMDECRKRDLKAHHVDAFTFALASAGLKICEKD